MKSVNQDCTALYVYGALPLLMFLAFIYLSKLNPFKIKIDTLLVQWDTYLVGGKSWLVKRLVVSPHLR